MKLTKIAGCVALLVLTGFGVAYGQEKFPARPITLTYGSEPGGAPNLATVAACKVAEKLLGKPIVIEYKTGGGGYIAVNIAARSKPDGYTLTHWYTALGSIRPHLTQVPLNVLKDVHPLCQFGNLYFLLVVRHDSPWQTFQKFMDHVKKNPAKVTYAAAQIGTGPHLAMLLIEQRLGVKLVPVHYKGAGPAVPALLGGHVDAAALTGEAFPHIRAGKMRLLAFLTYQPHPDFPDVPSLQTLGLADIPTFVGITGPVGIPDPVLKTLDNTFKKVVNDPEYINVAKNVGVGPVFRDHIEFKKYNAEAYHLYGKLIKDFDIK